MCQPPQCLAVPAGLPLLGTLATSCRKQTCASVAGPFSNGDEMWQAQGQAIVLYEGWRSVGFVFVGLAIKYDRGTHPGVRWIAAGTQPIHHSRGSSRLHGRHVELGEAS